MSNFKCETTGHEPDFDTVSLEFDGGEVYIDVLCKHCGESGCLGTASRLATNTNWETDLCEGGV